MKRRAWPTATTALGLATIGVSATFALLPAMRAAEGCMPAGAVVQFEFARDSADLARVFGAGGARCGPLIIAAMDAANQLDFAAFIPTYTAFALAAALFLSGGAPRPLAIAALAAALAAAACDYVETATLLRITRTLDAPEALLPTLGAAARAKFALLALHGVFCAGLCFLSERKRPILGALLLFPALATVLAVSNPSAFVNALGGAFALAWLGVLAAAIMSLLPAKGASV